MYIGLIIVIAVLFVFALLWGALGSIWPLSSLERGEVVRFAQAHRLSLTPDSGRYVVTYLVRSMRWRRWGGFAGLLVGFPLSVAFQHHSTTVVSTDGWTQTSSTSRIALNWLLLVGVGYFVGTLIAEWRSGAMTSGGKRVASLRPRRQRDYIDAALMRSAYATVLASLIILLATSLWPHYRARGPLSERIGLACAAAAVVGIVELTTRWVVARPLPVDTDDVGAAREAVRTSCVHLLAGVGVAFCWYLLSAEAFSSTSPSDGMLALIVTVVGLVAFVVCVRQWFGLRRAAWTTDRRPHKGGVRA
jgi:hypothetical protein